MPAEQGPRAVLRRLRHLRPQLLRRCGAGRRDPVAGGRQAGARAVHALGRARLGQLRSGASGRGARRRRRRRQDRRLRVSRLAARLDRHRDRRTSIALQTRRHGARQRLRLDHRQSDEHRLDVRDAEPARRQPRGADGRLSAGRARCARRSICRSRSRPSRRSTSWRIAAKMDPLEFRRKNIGDKRWLGVLNAAAEAASGQPRVAASALSDAEVVTGRGIGLGTHHVSYGAAVAEIEVNKRTGEIVAKQLYGAIDCGPRRQSGAGREPDRRPDDPGREPRAQGGSDVRQDRRHQPRLGVAIRSCALPSIPNVTPIVVQRLDEPSTGAGEEVMGATAAASPTRSSTRPACGCANTR